jgi:cytochrome c
MPDMVYTPAQKAQAGAMLLPPEHTVPRDFQPWQFGHDQEKAALMLKNPVPLNRNTVERGRHMFLTYCLPCHGPEGDGNGTIVPLFTMPPSLHSEKVRKWSDGAIYFVVQNGQNLMPSYASQIEPSDRWAIIHYIRSFQRARAPTPEDLKKFNKEIE